MKLNRFGAGLTALATGALLLSACGSETATEGACAGKEALRASGSSAQGNAMDRFVNAYEAKCPQSHLDYTRSGSGNGIKDFLGGQTDFAGTDVPLSAEEATSAKERCGGADAWNLPLVFGPIAVTYNVEGVANLVLDGPTTAKIFNGGITKWNDPAIAALNHGASLPDAEINVIYRSDQSGTTDNFQHYLDVASDGAWGKGTGKTFNGPVGEGKKGNEGTAAAIKETAGSITYNEWSFAQGEKLAIAQIVTSAGPDPVAISTESVGKTIDGATFKNQNSNDLVLDTDSFYKPTQAGAYPLVLATYEVVCSTYPDSAVGTAVRTFLQTAVGPGQDGLDQNGYVPIPDKFKSRLSTAIDAIK